MRIRAMKTMDASEDGFTLKTYEVGQVYNMGEKLSGMFVREGWGEEVEAAPEPGGGAADAGGSGATRPEDPNAVIAAILAVLPDLDEESEFTAAGAPKVEALVTRLGYEVSGAERDTAWAAHVAAPTDQKDAGPAPEDKDHGPATENRSEGSQA